MSDSEWWFLTEISQKKTHDFSLYALFLKIGSGHISLCKSFPSLFTWLKCSAEIQNAFGDKQIIARPSWKFAVTKATPLPWGRKFLWKKDHLAILGAEQGGKPHESATIHVYDPQKPPAKWTSPSKSPRTTMWYFNAPIQKHWSTCSDGETNSRAKLHKFKM